MLATPSICRRAARPEVSLVAPSPMEMSGVMGSAGRCSGLDKQRRQCAGAALIGGCAFATLLHRRLPSPHRPIASRGAGRRRDFIRTFG